MEVAGNEFYIVQIYNPSCGKPILEVRDIKDNNKVSTLSSLIGLQCESFLMESQMTRNLFSDC